MGIDRVRYRRPVHPGDVVEIEAVVKRLRSRMGVLSGAARVNGKVVCDGTMTFALGPRGATTQVRVTRKSIGKFLLARPVTDLRRASALAGPHHDHAKRYQSGRHEHAPADGSPEHDQAPSATAMTGLM